MELINDEDLKNLPDEELKESLNDLESIDEALKEIEEGDKDE